VLLAALIAGVPALMALGVLPSLMSDAAWSGGDTLLSETVGTIQEGYEPWVNAFFSPADLGIERYLFGLQALLGALLIAGFVGWLVGRRHAQTGVDGGERRNAMIIAVGGIVLALALFFVQTELGELQAFLTALQGVGAGTLGFFAGYPLGRRAGERAAPGPGAQVRARA
jgi:cobalt/nickel transport protein